MTDSSIRSTKPPPIPDTCRSKFLSPHQAIYQHRQVSGMSKFSVASSSVSDFLEQKLESCELDIAVLSTQLVELGNTLQASGVSREQYDSLSAEYIEAKASLQQEVKVVTKQRKVLVEDMEDEVELKRRRLNKDLEETELYEHAYRDTIVPKVMAASAKQTKTVFDTKKFRNNVLNAYGATKEFDGEKAAWCHLAGEWWEKSQIKAAHLVPKSLSIPEIGYLFGVEDVPKDFFYDWRLGISLHSKLEEGLDKGIIAIVPIPSSPITRWKCVLVDESERNRTITTYLMNTKNPVWGDIDHRELQFLGEKRPAKRYLYFRYIITVIHAQKTGNVQFLERVIHRNVFWSSPGPYLRKSTLVSLARNISGLELPPSVYEDETFNCQDSELELFDENATVIADRYIQATAASLRKDSSEEENSSEEEDREMDDVD